MSMRASLSKMLLVLALAGAARPAQAQPANPAPCAGPEYHQFDFWLGDWDVFENDGATKVAHVRVEPMLDGCIVRESYEDDHGLKGQSVSAYDRSRKVWHQTWSTNDGRLLAIEGGLKDGAMVMSGSFLADNGDETVVRGMWKSRRDGVRETAVTSTDRGRTWKPWFDLLFRRRSAAAMTSDDARAVAALDTAYQAAVKVNDSVTMDGILADDFILVTGSGKVFDKKALLADARARRTAYERQEDTEQVVRVWGDIAVVTAKLWEKGTTDGKSFDYMLWFSDTYVRTPAGWRYVFGQASLPLPKP